MYLSPNNIRVIKSGRASALMNAYKSLLKEGCLRNFVWRYGLDLAGSGLGPVTGF